MMLENDFVNSNTGLLDPRHLFGSMSQDVFRWPGLEWGTERQLLAQFITFLIMPGAPQILWGEEQRFHVMDSTSPDYLYGRQPMSSNRAWHIHGCYAAGYETYVDLPLGPALYGCNDDTNGLDRSEYAFRQSLRILMLLTFEHQRTLRTRFTTSSRGCSSLDVNIPH